MRTPVAVIKAELEGALRAGGHAPQVREALVASVEECDHLAQLGHRQRGRFFSRRPFSRVRNHSASRDKVL